MTCNAVMKPIFPDGIIVLRILESKPILRQLLWAKNKNVFVERFVVLDYRERRKRFTQANAVCKNAPVIGLQLVDYRKNGIALKILEHDPDLRFSELEPFLSQIVGRRIVQELMEDPIERGVID